MGSLMTDSENECGSGMDVFETQQGKHLRIAKNRVALRDKQIVELNEKIEIMDRLIEIKVQKNINMKRECNKRYGEQLQKIRKFEAEKMLQIQSKLFGDEV